MAAVRSELTPRGRQWQGLIAEWQRSGLSMRAFCAQRGVNAATLSWWRQELARRAPQTARGVMELVEIRRGAAAERDGSFELRLPNGIGLRVPIGFERKSLEELLDVLSQRC